MADIHCKSCGKEYNYRSHELCPKCGAYNRPRQAMRVGFDENGGVVLHTEQEFYAEAKAFDARDDACYEEQARKVRDDGGFNAEKVLERAGEELNKWGDRVEKWWAQAQKNGTSGGKKKQKAAEEKKKPTSAAGIIIRIFLIILAINIIGNVISGVTGLFSFQREPEGPPFASVEVETPPEEIVAFDEEEMKKIWLAEQLDTYSVEYQVSAGEVFDWQGVEMWISGWEVSGDPHDAFMVVGANANNALPDNALSACYLLLTTDAEDTILCYPDSYQNGAFIFRHLPIDPNDTDGLCACLIFDDYFDGVWVRAIGAPLMSDW